MDRSINIAELNKITRLASNVDDPQAGGAAYIVVDDLVDFYREIIQRGVRVDERSGNALGHSRDERD